jgi:predicted alpha/beta hydrolase family esterase
VYTFPASGFAPIPLQTIPFKTIMVASDNDPWVSLERAQYFAAHWGSQLVNIGAAGHINADSGYGKWEQGLKLLESFDSD